MDTLLKFSFPLFFLLGLSILTPQLVNSNEFPFETIDQIEKKFKHIKWSLVQEDKGIKIKSKKIGKNSILALKATGILNTSVEKIIFIFKETNLAYLWAPGLKERRMLQEISETEAVVYDIHKLPWPCLDRDLVIHNTIKLIKKRKQIALISSSVETYSKDPGSNGKVRAELYYSFIGLTPISKNKTKVEFFIHVNPKGSIPNWIINYILKTRPSGFLKAIEQRSNNIEPKIGPVTKKMVETLKFLLKKKINPNLKK
jgi:hypothetical protein